MLHGFINELDDVKSVLTTQDYLELCAALKVLHESKEMEATSNDDAFSRNIRAVRRKACGAFRRVLSRLRRLQELHESRERIGVNQTILKEIVETFRTDA